MKISKIVDALQYIDEDLVAEAITYRPDEKTMDEIIKISEGNGEEKAMKKKGKIAKRMLLVAALIAVLVLGTLTVAVAAFRRILSKGLKEEFHISEEQEEEILQRKDELVQFIETEADEFTTSEDETTGGMTTMMEDITVANCNGITVTLTQAMVDGYHIILTFRAEGLPEEYGKNIGFSEHSLYIDGEHAGSGGGSGNYIGQGVKEYTWSLRPRDIYLEGPGWFFGKQLEITLKDLDVYINKETGSKLVMEGEWNLRWTIRGTEESKTYELNHELGSTGAIITKVTVSPLSVDVRYQMPLEEYKVITDKGNTFSNYEEPPYLRAVIMKDGTMYTNVTEMNLSGFINKETLEYIDMAKMRYYLDVEQIASLVFVDLEKELLDENGKLLDHVYVVSLQK